MQDLSPWVRWESVFSKTTLLPVSSLCSRVLPVTCPRPRPVTLDDRQRPTRAALAGAGHVPAVTAPLLCISAKCTGGVGRRCRAAVGAARPEDPGVCCFAVLPLLEVVAPQVPAFQPIVTRLLPPRPLPLVHLPLGAAGANLPLPALHPSVQTFLHPCGMAGKAFWSHLSYGHQS